MKGQPMRDANYKPGGDQEDARELDAMLDAGLAKYAAVEPRAGLEDRILAHLHSEHTRPQHAWLQWGFVGAVVAITVVAILAWKSTQPLHPVNVNHSAAIQQPSLQVTKPEPDAADETTPKAVSLRKPSSRHTLASERMAHPKLDQFPSPQPLSREEIALIQYVKNFPKEARLISQAQEEFALEAQKEMNDAGLDGQAPDSIQQER
jgi:hypothetical protein